MAKVIKAVLRKGFLQSLYPFDIAPTGSYYFRSLPNGIVAITLYNKKHIPRTA